MSFSFLHIIIIMNVYFRITQRLARSRYLGISYLCICTENTLFFIFLFFYYRYVHIPSSKIIKKDNDTETRTNVTTIEQGLHGDAAVMVGH